MRNTLDSYGASYTHCCRALTFAAARLFHFLLSVLVVNLIYNTAAKM